MPTIDIPDIDIVEIYIPDIEIPQVYVPQASLPGYEPLNVETIGCKYFHRDVKNTGNRNLLIEDSNGVSQNCPYPSFLPINFQPDQLIIVEEAAVVNDEPETLPEGKPPQAEIPKDEKKEDVFVECPSKKDQRVGDFRNEKKLERVIGHSRSEDGTICTTLYEDVPFKDQYLPEFSTVISTAAIATVAAVTPLLLSAVKPLVKQLIKRIAKVFEGKKNKVR